MPRKPALNSAKARGSIRKRHVLQGWVVIVVALGYIGLLFVVASYGDRMRGARRRAARGC